MHISRQVLYKYHVFITRFHDMEKLSELLAPCEGSPPVTGTFPLKKDQQYGALFFSW